MKLLSFVTLGCIMLLTTLLLGSKVWAQGGYISPDFMTQPSHEEQYESIVGPPTIDTISITAPARQANQQLYILRQQNQGGRGIYLDESENISLLEDFATNRIAVRFGAFHTPYYDVKIYNEDRELIFRKQGSEVFAGEQVIIPYQELEGGRYFLHVDTNDGTVIKRHLYKPYQYHTSSQ